MIMTGSSDWHRRFKRLIRVGCYGYLCVPAFASYAAAQMDTANFYAAARNALGGQEISGIEFGGEGWDACLGQAWSVAEGWARWELTGYSRVIDYGSGSSSHTTQRRAGMDPERIGGCGAQPGANAAPQQGAIDNVSAWSEQLMIWLTPHGFLRLLQAGQSTITSEGSGWQVTLPLVRDDIAYTLIGIFNNDFEVESIRTWIDDPIFGDMEISAEFGPYRQFGGLAFPETFALKQGGFPTLWLAIDSVAPIAAAPQPVVRRAAAPVPVAGVPAYTEIGEGIFAIHGSYQAVAVEFDDFSMVIDGLQSDSRVEALIRAVKDAIPGKPIRYVVSTHSHFDHAYGLRQFAAEGAMILTHQMNVEFFEQALSTPRTLRVNSTEPAVVPVNIEGIDGRYEITDGSGQVVELHALGPSPHAADMVIAYLPSIKAVVEADVLQPWINPVFSGGPGPHPFLVYLAEELARAGVDYERFVPIHVPPEPPLMERAALEAVLAVPRGERE